MLRWLVCIGAMLAAAPAVAADVTALETLEVGLFHARTTGHYPSPQAVNERTNILANVDFYKLTTKVPARQGIRFGTRFRIVGAPANGSANLRAVWRIPEPGIQDPVSGTHYRQSISDATVAIGTITMRGYTFDALWEIRCGDWIQEIWVGARKLLSQTFTVEDCQGVPTVSRAAAAPAG